MSEQPQELRAGFHRQIDAIDQKVVRLFALVPEAVAAANEALLGDDADALAQVRAGSAYWNCCDRVSPRLPWSGVRDSGMGLTLSRYGIQVFTRTKAWHLRASC